MIEEVLDGERVRLQPVRPSDAAELTVVFSDPTVSRWWGDPAERVDEALHPDQGESSFLIVAGVDVAGFIQCYEEPAPMYRHATIDIAVRAEWQGQGVGPEAIRVLARHLFTARGHHRLTIDPAVANVRAVAAYKRVGFVPVGVMRRYERGGDGAWHDGLLMDLLTEELRS
ncbi:MAG TPA: GNAT family protein [Candidatus Angelobacter sp.]|jgi:aminoglycoside 6'-N-acetyltransferase|nr:GNAT family protein [Candidatus Angelobacter sp.]